MSMPFALANCNLSFHFYLALAQVQICGYVSRLSAFHSFGCLIVNVTTFYIIQIPPKVISIRPRIERFFYVLECLLRLTKFFQHFGGDFKLNATFLKSSIKYLIFSKKI